MFWKFPNNWLRIGKKFTNFPNQILQIQPLQPLQRTTRQIEIIAIQHQLQQQKKQPLKLKKVGRIWLNLLNRNLNNQLLWIWSWIQFHKTEKMWDNLFVFLFLSTLTTSSLTSSLTSQIINRLVTIFEPDEADGYNHSVVVSVARGIELTLNNIHSFNSDKTNYQTKARKLLFNLNKNKVNFLNLFRKFLNLSSGHSIEYFGWYFVSSRFNYTAINCISNKRTCRKEISSNEWSKWITTIWLGCCESRQSNERQRIGSNKRNRI